MREQSVDALDETDGEVTGISLSAVQASHNPVCYEDSNGQIWESDDQSFFTESPHPFAFSHMFTMSVC
jgi:hypothetical protein